MIDPIARISSGLGTSMSSLLKRSASRERDALMCQMGTYKERIDLDSPHVTPVWPTPPTLAFGTLVDEPCLGGERRGVLLTISRVQMGRDPPEDLLNRHPAGRELDRPGPARMQDVPRRSILRRSPSAGIVIAETVDHHVPDRLVPADQHALGHADPYLVDHQVSAGEVAGIEVVGAGHGLGVVGEAGGERQPMRRVEVRALAPALRVGLAHVDRRLESALAVAIDDRRVGLEGADIVEGVDAGADERVNWG